MSFDFDNSYARDLDGFYISVQAAKAPSPKLVLYNTGLAAELGLDPEALTSPAAVAVFAGSRVPAGAAPLAQAYAGHQFGGFSPQLGDGRATLLGEVIDTKGRRRDIQLKGSGRTPFSRGGDGKAVLGPVLREYLMGEAMHALRIPTTRALAAVTTGDDIMRDGIKPGAVLTRVAASHIRVGTFQFFAARKEWDKVQQLADYAIARHYPDLANKDDKYLGFLSHVAIRQATLLARWMQVGFVHGVMNTDNMTISGETIDYGPCAFIDQYDPQAVFSSIDRNGRYAYGNQPIMAQWNLARLAETLLMAIDPDDSENANRLASEVIGGFSGLYAGLWQSGMRAKIGLADHKDGDDDLINALHAAMQGQGVDFTTLFRTLSEASLGQPEAVTALFADKAPIEHWLLAWQDRLQRDSQTSAIRVANMRQVNPLYIPRNHLVEHALQAAEQQGDYAPIHQLLDVLAQPFTARDGLQKYEGPAPVDFGPYRTFCGT
ncbi:MAG: YdiU family protein [Rhodobacteraceae bacterium]|nr:YdiU family protein [Paracoccaceae bacterium]